MLKTTTEIINGHSLRLAKLGNGKPLLLLHGYPENLQIWSELAPLLSGHYEIIAIDWPGMGESESWKGGATPEHMAERLNTIIDFLGLTKTAIAAMDMGGQPALVFAAEHPERVERLIIMNSLVAPEEKTSWEIRVLRKYGWNRFLIRNFPRLIFFRAEKTFLPPRAKLPSELKHEFWGSFHRPEVRQFIAKMCAGYQGTLHRLPELYSRIDCPVLILWAENDKHFPIDHAKFLQSCIRNSILEIIPGGHHWLVLNKASEVVKVILMDRP